MKFNWKFPILVEKDDEIELEHLDVEMVEVTV